MNSISVNIKVKELPEEAIESILRLVKACWGDIEVYNGLLTATFEDTISFRAFANGLNDIFKK